MHRLGFDKKDIFTTSNQQPATSFQFSVVCYQLSVVSQVLRSIQYLKFNIKNQLEVYVFISLDV